MSKERKALDDFIKDYLFLCEKLYTNKQEKMLLDGNSPYNVLKTYLESIDNAEPSEALECLEKVYSRLPQWDLSRNIDQCNTIKQALLKIQETKHYLKWEDLEFTYGEWNKIEVYQGNEKLGISYKSDFDFFDNSYEVVKIYNLKTKSRICKIYDKDKQFFNNLHLEVVENE